ncbi:hypothetical protein ABT116_28415, partial [Streptomyces sp. NPDC002130]
MHPRSTLTALAAAALLASAATTTASAATAPVTRPRITAHFDLAAARQPENITLDTDGSAYLTFSFARQIARVDPSGRTQVLATLPAPGKAETPTLGKAFVGGIARAPDGTFYVTYATGTGDLTGIWAVRPGAAPHGIAALPARADGHAGEPGRPRHRGRP